MCTAEHSIVHVCSVLSIARVLFSFHSLWLCLSPSCLTTTLTKHTHNFEVYSKYCRSFGVAGCIKYSVRVSRALNERADALRVHHIWFEIILRNQIENNEKRLQKWFETRHFQFSFSAYPGIARIFYPKFSLNKFFFVNYILSKFDKIFIEIVKKLIYKNIRKCFKVEVFASHIK